MATGVFRRRSNRGFTLVELIMVIVIMGIVGGMVTVFMKSPIDAYFASARRAGLTDVADTAVRRMARDIRKALPNSVHAPTNQCIEFIPTKTGARYRNQDSGSLAFGTAVTSFNMLGLNSALSLEQQIQTNDLVAVSNLGFDVGDAYAGTNTAKVNSVTNGASESTITIPSSTFSVALASPSNRFQVIPASEKVVAFVCSGGTLYRTVNTAMTKTADGSACTTSGGATLSVATLATNVSSCNLAYSGSDLQRNALVQMTLQFTDTGETTSIYHEVHVNNTP